MAISKEGTKTPRKNRRNNIKQTPYTVEKKRQKDRQKEKMSKKLFLPN